MDRECYILYMGKGERNFRPFLRIGTSPYLPGDIRRHIGSVVLPDRMTGDYFQEVENLEKPITRNMHYVGSTELIKAVRHFVRKEEISLQPIESVTDKPEETGSKVHFFRDGNLRVFIDGHRLFDLLEREKIDNHLLYIYQRIDEICDQESSGLNRRNLKDPGFIHVPGAGFLAFDNGIVQTSCLSIDALRAMTTHLIPLRLITRFAGPSNRDTLFSLVKWLHVNNDDFEFVMEDLDADTGETSELERDLLELMEHIDARARARGSLQFSADVPAPPDYLPTNEDDGRVRNRLALQADQPLPGDATLQLPEDSQWRGGIQPPLMAGIPYFLKELTSRSWKTRINRTQERLLHLMGSSARNDLKDYSGLSITERSERAAGALKTTDDPIETAGRLLWMWNEEILASGSPEAVLGAAGRDRLENIQSELLLPLRGLTVNVDKDWTFAFELDTDLTRADIRQRMALRDKVIALYDWQPPREKYEEERKRLTAVLGQLLASHELRQAPGSTSAQTESGPDESGKAADADSTVAAAGTAAAGAGAPPAVADKSIGRADTGRGGGARRSGGGSKRRGPLGAILGAALILAIIAGLLWILVIRPDAPLQRNQNRQVASGQNSDQITDQTAAQETEQTPDQSSQAAGQTSDQSSADSSGRNDDSPSDTADVDNAAAADSGTAADTAADSSAADSTAAGDSSGADTAAAADGTSSEAAAGSTADNGTAGADSSAADRGPASSADSTGTSAADSQFTPDSRWSPQEILTVTNWIASHNGYARIGEVSALKNNPDWIYTGNRLQLPNSEYYDVTDGDILWTIADHYLTSEFEKSGSSIDEFRVNINMLNYTQ